MRVGTILTEGRRIGGLAAAMAGVFTLVGAGCDSKSPSTQQTSGVGTSPSDVGRNSAPSDDIEAIWSRFPSEFLPERRVIADPIKVVVAKRELHDAWLTRKVQIEWPGRLRVRPNDNQDGWVAELTACPRLILRDGVMVPCTIKFLDLDRARVLLDMQGASDREVVVALFKKSESANWFMNVLSTPAERQRNGYEETAFKVWSGSTSTVPFSVEDASSAAEYARWESAICTGTVEVVDVKLGAKDDTFVSELGVSLVVVVSGSSLQLAAPSKTAPTLVSAEIEQLLRSRYECDVPAGTLVQAPGIIAEEVNRRAAHPLPSDPRLRLLSTRAASPRTVAGQPSWNYSMYAQVWSELNGRLEALRSLSPHMDRLKSDSRYRSLVDAFVRVTKHVPYVDSDGHGVPIVEAASADWPSSFQAPGIDEVTLGWMEDFGGWLGTFLSTSQQLRLAEQDAVQLEAAIRDCEDGELQQALVPRAKQFVPNTSKPEEFRWTNPVSFCDPLWPERPFSGMWRAATFARDTSITWDDYASQYMHALQGLGFGLFEVRVNDPLCVARVAEYLGTAHSGPIPLRHLAAFRSGVRPVNERLEKFIKIDEQFLIETLPIIPIGPNPAVDWSPLDRFVQYWEPFLTAPDESLLPTRPLR